MPGFGSKTLCTNAGAGTTTPIFWPGGLAMMILSANFSGGGNAKLEVQSSDGSTWVTVTSSTLSANGTLTTNLPACAVRLNITTATAVYASLHHIAQS